MIPSPYAPGALPEYLAGRGSELVRVGDRLARSQQLGRSGGPLLAFHGPRGLGKTSLLREAQRQAVDAGLLTLWHTGRDDVELAPVLAAALAEVLRQESLGRRAIGALEHVESASVEVGVGVAKLGVEVGHDTAAPSVEQSLAEGGRIARAHGRAGLVLFLDEAQEAAPADLRSLLIALQHFDGAPGGVPVSVVAAGLPSLIGVVPEAATFGERTDFVEIGLLTDVATAEALRVPAEHHGVAWSDAAIETAIDLAVGYPHQVQLVGDGAWAAARPDRGDLITDGHVTQGAESARARMAVLFRSRLSKLTPELRRTVDAMAALADGPVRRTAVAERLGIESSALSRPRQELIDRGLVEPAGHGLLRFTIPGFAEHVREQALVEGDG